MGSYAVLAQDPKCQSSAWWQAMEGGVRDKLVALDRAHLYPVAWLLQILSSTVIREQWSRVASHLLFFSSRFLRSLNSLRATIPLRPQKRGFVHWETVPPEFFHHLSEILSITNIHLFSYKNTLIFLCISVLIFHIQL